MQNFMFLNKKYCKEVHDFISKCSSKIKDITLDLFSMSLLINISKAASELSSKILKQMLEKS
jgi:hypothetical protein